MNKTELTLLLKDLAISDEPKRETLKEQQRRLMREKYLPILNTRMAKVRAAKLSKDTK